MLNDTIAAISTALQDGAISVIRISGPDSLAIAGRLFSRRVDDQPTHTVRYGYIIDPISKEAVDEVLLTVFRKPLHAKTLWKSAGMADATLPGGFWRWYWRRVHGWLSRVSSPAGPS